MLRYIKTEMMLLSIAYIVIGMMLLVMPQTSLLWICYAFGAVVLITGIVCLVQYARIRGTGFTAPFMLVGGVITACIGVFTLARPPGGCQLPARCVRYLHRCGRFEPHRHRHLTLPSARGRNGGCCCCSASFRLHWALCWCCTL